MDSKLKVIDGENGKKYGQVVKDNNDFNVIKNGRLLDIEADIKDAQAMFLANSNGRGKISENINGANELPTDVYKREVTREKRNKKKRTIFKPKVFNKVKKFLVVGAGALSVALAAKGASEVKDYKQKVYTEALNTVKTAISESVENTSPDQIKIYDKSSKIDESTYKEAYVVEINDEEYRYTEINGNGNKSVLIDEIKNYQVKDAIKIVANAKGGNLSDARKAEELAKKVKDGEINVSMKNAVEYKERLNRDNGRE